ncbi:uncharacterized protein TNCV_3372651 [Trichonephila clavipes]|nr:uncharacterized protein TNCV_3372651 [Trichonephila clavipes]
MEAGWSTRRVARQLGRCDCVVRKCWDQAQDILDTPVVKKTASSGATHEENGLQRNGTRSSLAVNPESISAVMTIVFVCGDPRDERLNPVFALQGHTTPTAGVMVWGAIAHNTRHP